MNITLSADDEVVEKARQVAQRQGTSLNELVRGYLQTLAGQQTGADAAQELLTLMNEQGGHSKGQHFGREAAYEDRVK